MGVTGHEKKKAVERLSARLFATMEHLDPTDDFDWDLTAEENWGRLDSRRKMFYELCIHELLAEPLDIKIALGGERPNNH